MQQDAADTVNKDARPGIAISCLEPYRRLAPVELARDAGPRRGSRPRPRRARFLRVSLLASCDDVELLERLAQEEASRSRA
ncbi:MAG: DUF3343 domain-containing protein [Eggerthellaceae bacterium]